MQAIISVRGLSISKSYKDALTRRLAKLEPLFPRIIEVKIVLSKEKHRRTAALTLAAEHHTFRSEETAADLEAAVDMAIDALGRQVRETKDRLKNRKGRHAPRRAPAGARPTPTGVRRSVIRQRLSLKPMTLGDAVEQLRTSPEEFLVFADDLTGSINVLYRRRDGGLGLIEPVA